MSFLSLQQFGFIEDGSYDDLCALVGEMLNLEKPVSSAVVKRAMEDGRYAFYLTMSRNSPTLLERLLDQPSKHVRDGASEISVLAGNRANRTQAHSTKELVKHAAQAMLRWSKAGFRQTAPEEFEKRWSACQTCSHLIEAPQKALYKVVKFKVPDTRICTLCGCIAYRKAMVSTESCPCPAPESTLVTRWGGAINPSD